MTDFTPAYVDLRRQGTLQHRVEQAYARLAACDLCPRRCGVDRRGGDLVLPNGLAGSEEITCFLVNEVSPNTYLNVMRQYRPAYRANRYPELNRPISRDEYQAAVQAALDAGLHRLDSR